MQLESISRWWQDSRPFFEAHASSAVSRIDDEALRLEKLSQAPAPFFICALGQSAVGKSTLLNAIVAGNKSILPAGGIGPLTALATEVRYSADPFFEVRYRKRRQLDGFRLTLENELRRQNAVATDVHAVVKDAETGAATEPLEDATADASMSPSGDTSFAELKKQITQLVTNDQFLAPDLADLVVAYRAVLGLKSLDQLIQPEFAHFARSAHEALQRSLGQDTVLFKQTDYKDTYDQLLGDHVTGHLAPLVESLTIGHPSELLRAGIVLVDLPGVGVASDRYRAVTLDYVRNQASAILFVVDRAGPTSASADLLRESGYWDRLILSSEDPETDPCSLIVAVTRIDDLAKQEYLDNKKLPEKKPMKVAEIFATLRTKVRDQIRAQLRSFLASLSESAESDEAVAAARNNAQATLQDSLQVFPVSATEYRLYLDDDEVMPSFIKDVESSGVPELIRHIADLAAQRSARITTARTLVEERLQRTISSTLTQIENNWTTSTRAEQEAAKLRIELDRFLEPLRLELASRSGAYREFLESTGSTRIGDLVAKAQSEASHKVARYLSKLSDYNWSTLRATVRRGGAFVSGTTGKRIDLAADIAQTFQEDLSGVWSAHLLKDIRKKTKEHGSALHEMIGEICDWADERSESSAQRAVLENQRQLMVDRVAQLSEVGSEAIDELKKTIKSELKSSIEGPIRIECEAFQKRGDDEGAGVKKRIIELFESLATNAVQVAAGPANRLLQKRFNEVRIEIIAALENWGDPIQQAADAIAEREEQRKLRSDAQRRSSVLGQVNVLQTSLRHATHEMNNSVVA